MALNTEQRERRTKRIGSSDAAAILNLDPYRSASDVWLEKTGRAAGFAGNAATERGNLLEPVLLDWAEGELGVTLQRDVFVECAEYPHLCANLDGFCSEKNFNVEAKSTVNADEWGEPGTDKVPERVIIQVTHAMLLAKTDKTYIPMICPGFKSFDWRMYEVPFNRKLAEFAAEQCDIWWKQHVIGDTPPVGSVPSIEVLKRVRRQPNKIVPVSDELVDAWIVLKAAHKQAKEDEEKAQAALIASLGDAEQGEAKRGTLSYMETSRRGYSVDPCTYRTLRLKAAK